MKAGRILAIDPGPTASGVVVLDLGMLLAGPRGFVPTVIEHDPAETVLRIRERTREMEWLCAVVVEGWESYAGGKKGRPLGADAWGTIRVIGRCEEMADRQGVPCTIITRPEAARILAGARNASEPQVYEACRACYPATGGGKDGRRGVKHAPGPLYGVRGHAWSALAVGLAWYLREEGR